MDWLDATFLHWPIDARLLRPLIPSQLSIDTYDGQAWIGIVAFRIECARLRGLPSFMRWRAFGEVNVRTYVTDGKRPGVWFLSLDAAHREAVRFGRGMLHLPYHYARIEVDGIPSRPSYRSVREVANSNQQACFEASVTPEPEIFEAAPGSIDCWFAERYAFYTVEGHRTVRGDVEHRPWPLQRARAKVMENTLLAAWLPKIDTDPSYVHWSQGVETKAYPLQKIHERGIELFG